MSDLPLIVFDVNETLLDLESLTPTFERIFGERSALRLWFAQLILYSEALTLARAYVPFTDIGGAVLKMVATTQGISISGNAYEEGLSDGWNPIRTYWREPTKANRDALRSFLSPETTFWQYTHGVSEPSAVSPDGYSLDDFYMARPGAHEAQLC
jgi:hypothetical protein